MYVFGDNEMGTTGNPSNGEDYGTFSLFADNEWIKNAIDTDPALMGTLLAGDVNRDSEVSGDGTGPVGSDDVSAFVAGWLSENRFQSADDGLITAGDWNTWGLGDLNLDGRTSLADALILHNELLANGSDSGLDFGLLAGGTTVPEPTAITLLGLATVGLILIRRQKRPSFGHRHLPQSLSQE